MSTTLKNLFPNGSKSRSGGGLRPREPRRWAHPVEDGDEEAQDYDDEYWTQDADGCWYEWDDEAQNYVHYGDEEVKEDDAFHIEDETDRTLAAEDTRATWTPWSRSARAVTG